MADTPAAIGIRFAFRQYMDLWHCYQLAAMLLLPSTSWRPATAGCGGGFIFLRSLLFLFGGIFGLLLRELLSLSRVRAFIALHGVCSWFAAGPSLRHACLRRPVRV